MKAGILIVSLLAVLLAAATGCKVKVDKSSDGDNVKIATPFGGIAVNKDQTSAAETWSPRLSRVGGGHRGRREQVSQSRHGFRLLQAARKSG